MSKFEWITKLSELLPQVWLLAWFVKLTAADISATFRLPKIFDSIKNLRKYNTKKNNSREISDIFSQLFVNDWSCNFIHNFGRYKVSLSRSIDKKICLVKVLWYKEKPVLWQDFLEIKKQVINYYFICDFDDFVVLKTLIDSQSENDRNNFELDIEPKKEFISFLNSIINSKWYKKLFSKRQVLLEVLNMY